MPTQETSNSATFHQMVLLDQTGNIRYSCESLFSLKPYQKESLLNISPFLESVYPQLLGMSLGSKAARYHRLDNPFPGLFGMYDFSFQWVHIHDGQYILWSIYDLSDLYRTIQEKQQRRNEEAISAEKLASIKKKDIQIWSNFAKE